MEKESNPRIPFKVHVKSQVDQGPGQVAHAKREKHGQPTDSQLGMGPAERGRRTRALQGHKGTYVKGTYMKGFTRPT